jgi:phosphoribosylamine-glycine ligase
VFHAGTRPDPAKGPDAIVTAGGRVLGVTALAADLRRARDLSREAAGKIRFKGAFFRHDLVERVLGGSPAASPSKPDARPPRRVAAATPLPPVHG